MSERIIEALRRGCEDAIKRGSVLAISPDEQALNEARLDDWHDAKGKHRRIVDRKLALRNYNILTNDWAVLERRLDSPLTKADNPKHSS